MCIECKKLLIYNVLLKQEVAGDIKPKLAELRRETSDTATIFIGAGTCGLGAGANKTILAVEEYLKDNNLKAEIAKIIAAAYDKELSSPEQSATSMKEAQNIIKALFL